jgi:hypothetical protein
MKIARTMGIRPFLLALAIKSANAENFRAGLCQADAIAQILPACNRWPDSSESMNRDAQASGGAGPLPGRRLIASASSDDHF